MKEDGDFPRRGRDRPAGLTGVGVSQESVLILAAPQWGGRRRLILRQSREAGDAHVVHRRVGSQSALLAGLVLCRHPLPHPPAAQRLPEVAAVGGGCEGGGRGLSSWAAGRGQCPGLTLPRLLRAVSLQWARRCRRMESGGQRSGGLGRRAHCSQLLLQPQDKSLLPSS
jgi:hypothetical protein